MKLSSIATLGIAPAAKGLLKAGVKTVELTTVAPAKAAVKARKKAKAAE